MPCLHIPNPTAHATLQVDAAIVDLDGTMIDTLGDFTAALHAALADMGLPPVPRQAIARMVGKGTDHLLHSVLLWLAENAAPLQKAPPEENHGAGPLKITPAIAAPWLARQPELLKHYQRHYIAINGQHARVYPGVREGLQALRDAGLALACVTNKPAAFTTPLLRLTGLDALFTHVFGGDAFERKKPDPLPLLRACQALGTPPQRTLMLGDSSNDAQAAHAAGCPVILLEYGYNHGQSVRSIPAAGYAENMTHLRVD